MHGSNSETFLPDNAEQAGRGFLLENLFDFMHHGESIGSFQLYWMSRINQTCDKKTPHSGRGLLSFLASALVGDQQKESDGDDHLTHLNSGGLPGSEIWNLRPQLGAKAEYVCHAGENGYYIPGGNHADADICRDGTVAISPEGHQTNISAYANGSQSHQKNGYLHEPDHRTTIQVEKSWTGAHQENQQADQRNGQAGADAEAGGKRRQGCCIRGNGSS
jgi:hypothetical protein